MDPKISENDFLTHLDRAIKGTCPGSHLSTAAIRRISYAVLDNIRPFLTDDIEQKG